MTATCMAKRLRDWVLKFVGLEIVTTRVIEITVAAAKVALVVAVTATAPTSNNRKGGSSPR